MYLYDSYQLDSIAGMGSSGPPWSANKTAFAEAFRARMAQVLAAVLPPPPASAAASAAGARGGVFPACFSHGNTLSDKFGWQQVSDAAAGGSATLGGALASWLFGDASVPLRTLDGAAGALGNAFCRQASPSRSVALAVDADGGVPLNTVDDHAWGVNIDTGSLYHGLFATSGGAAAAAVDADFVRLAALLAPAQLRIGGGAADAMLFSPDGPAGAGPNIFPGGLNGQITNVNAASWRAVEGFARATGLSLLWDVNGFAFRENITWGAYNSSGTVPWPQNKSCPTACTHDAPFLADNANLTAFLDLVVAEGSCVDAISIGNEPDLFYRYGLTLSGAQLARDLLALQARLASPRFAAALGGGRLKLAGPAWAGFSAADAAQFFQGMAAAGPYLATTHDYPIPNSQQSASASSGCDVPSYSDLGRFVDPARGLSANVRSFVAALNASGAAAARDPALLGSAVPRDAAAPRLVLEETATSALGGCANLSDRFVAGFYLLNALLEPLEAGYQQVNYQDLVGWSFTARPSQYALLGNPGWVGAATDAPLRSRVKPTFLALLLLKQLLGPVALAASWTPGIAEDTTFSAKAWCAGSHFSEVAAGSVVLVYANAAATPVNLSVTAAGGGGRALPLAPRTEYFLTAPGTAPTEAGLLAERLLLNGAPIDGASFAYPFTGGREVAAGGEGALLLPGFSYGFVVLKAAGSVTCAARSTRRAKWAVKDCGGGGGAATAAAAAGGLGAGGIAGVVIGVLAAAALVAAAALGVLPRCARKGDGAGAPLLARWAA